MPKLMKPKKQPKSGGPSLDAVGEKVEAFFVERGVPLTLGGEPTYVPVNPEGAEWSVAALGPTKLRFGYAMAAALTQQTLPLAVTFFGPGNSYPGEVTPRWTLSII